MPEDVRSSVRATFDTGAIKGRFCDGGDGGARLKADKRRGRADE
jgi:hypothetical protein